MIVGRRAAAGSHARRVGHEYEDVEFPAADGVDLSGWFIPAAGDGPGPAVVFVHGWLWNRLGNVAGQVPVPDKDVDFLPAAEALHDAGYHVLLFDLSNHGESGRRLPITYGMNEARTSPAPSPTCAARPTSTPSGSAPRLLDGRERGDLRPPAGEGHPRRPARPPGALQPQLRARRARAARAAMLQARSTRCTACSGAPLPQRPRPGHPRTRPPRRHDRPVRPGHRRPVGRDGGRRGDGRRPPPTRSRSSGTSQPGATRATATSTRPSTT